MACLTLYFLGPPRIERDGAPVEVDTRKAIALLAYLAVTGESRSRDALATLLWPQYDQSRGRAALRRTLSALNKGIQGDWIESDRESIGLKRTDGLWVDVDAFQARLAACRTHGHAPNEVCPACLERLSEAAALYRDDFLAGFTLRDSANFDEWQFFQTESLRRDLAGALERLVEGYSAQGEFEPAIAYARRWLALDSLNEVAHRALMRLYAWSEQRPAALRQYRECVQVLEEELGVPPLEETTQLYQAIVENRVPARPPSTPRPSEGGRAAPSPALDSGAPVAGGDYPLVGRSAELAALLERYAAIGTDGYFVALEGEAGIGKTRLAEEFQARVRAGGATVISTRCYEGESNLAYGPFVEGLRGAIARPELAARLAQIPPAWLGEVARLLPELAAPRPGAAPGAMQPVPPPPPLDNPGAQSRFFEGVSQVLLRLSAGSVPAVLFLDDLHWADAASLDLLTYFARRLRGRPIMILAAWRSDELPASHPLRQLVAELQRARLGTTVPLARLDRPAVVELVQSLAIERGRPPEEVSERLYQETEGLPFFLVEYLAAMRHRGDEDPDDGWTLPGGVRDLLRARLAGVSETGWQLLSTAAVIGRSFDFDTLQEASGRSEEETIAALEELTSRGYISEVSGGRAEGTLLYDFNHEKLRTLVYEETSLARRRLLHRRVANALAERERHSPDTGTLAGQIAQHYQLAGQERQAAEYFKLAGERARRLYANAEATTHFRAALALGHPETASLHEAIGDLQTLSGEYAEALASYETAAALARPEALARLEQKLGTVHHRRGAWELATGHFRAALEALGESGHAGERARVYADWALTVHHGGEGRERASELAQRALELAEAASDRRALAQAHNILGILARSEQAFDRASRHFEASLALAEALGDPAAQAAALNNLALTYGASGDVERAIQLAEAGLRLSVSQGDRHREAAFHNNLADLFHAAGRQEAAMDHLTQAVTIYAEIGTEAGDWQPEIWKLVEW